MRSQERPRVLIVDDDPWIRESLTFLLSEAGFETLTASDGVEALDTLLVSEGRLVVLLDLLMPKMTGFEVPTHIAHDDHLATQHGYITSSAKASTANRIGPHFVALLQRLNIPFIARPFDIDALLQVVEEIACRLLPLDATEEGVTGGAKGSAQGSAQGRKDIPHSA